MVEADNPFRRLNEYFDFVELAGSLARCYSELGTTGIAVEKGFKALFVQFWEDYSDREMENAIKLNIGVRKVNAAMKKQGLFGEVFSFLDASSIIAVKNIAPNQGLVFMNKGYDYQAADKWIRANGGALVTLRKKKQQTKEF